MTETPNELLIETLGMSTRAWAYGNPSGEALIMVHGFRGDHHGLEPLAQQLSQHRPDLNIVVPDLPGFGATPAVPGREHSLDVYGEWLAAFAAGVTDSPIHILGHSFGSLVVSNALAQGLNAGTVSLINPISSPALEGPKAALTKLAIAYYWAADRLPERAARALLGNQAIVRVMSIVMAKTPDPELRAWIHSEHAAHFSSFADTGTLLQAFTASVSHTVSEYVSAITQPCLLIVGDKDDLTPLAAQLDLHRALPGSTFHVLPGVGHLVHYEAVEPSSSWISDFLAQHVDGVSAK